MLKYYYKTEKYDLFVKYKWKYSKYSIKLTMLERYVKHDIILKGPHKDLERVLNQFIADLEKNYCNKIN